MKHIHEAAKMAGWFAAPEGSVFRKAYKEILELVNKPAKKTTTKTKTSKTAKKGK